MATQKTPRAQPMTLVQDQSRPARPHLQPASKTASMTSPIVRSPRGVAQFNPRDDPRSAAAISNCQTRRPPVSQTSSPRLPCLPPERARIGGPTRARQPASVERLDSRASGGQVSRPLWMSRLKPQPSAAVSRIALVTACSGELAAPGELLARLALMGSDVVPRKWSRNTPGRDGNASPIRRCVHFSFLRSFALHTIIPRSGLPAAGAMPPSQSNRSMQRGGLPSRRRRGRIGNLLICGVFRGRLQQKGIVKHKIDTGDPCAEPDTDPLNLLLIVVWQR